MAQIYAYAPDEQECANIGLVGALLARDASFELRAGEFGELSFTHPVDPWGKWKALRDGVILKTMVPVRLVPEVDDGAYVGTVDLYRVSYSATKYQRYIYYASTSEKDPTYEAEVATGEVYKRGENKGKPRMKKYQKTKHKKLLKRGARVTVLADPGKGDPSSPYRLKVRVGKGKKRVTGYMERAGLEVLEISKPVPQTHDGLEGDAPSYAIQQQLFRIYEVETEADGGDPGSVTVRARRLVYDLLGNICTYKATTNVSCQKVCRGILSRTAFSHPFTVFSDIGDKHVGIDFRDMNPIAALIDPEEGVVAHWGGEVVCDDYDIYLLRRAGMDRGVTIRYGKDLEGVRCSLDSSNVATAVRPVGEKANGEPLYLDGRRMMLDGEVWYGYNYNEKSGTCANYLPEGYRFAVDDDGTQKTSIVERDIAWDGYAIPKAISLPVADAKVTKVNKNTDPSETSVLTTALARVMLAEAALEALEGGCDVPEISMEVDFTQLGDTAEYAQYRHLEPLFIYDTVTVSHPRVAVKARVDLTRLTWDVAGERVTGAGFGSLGDAVARIPGWQISGISGGKISPGSVNSGQIAAEAIATEHIQAGSINADAIQARAVTADKIAAGAVDAQSISAVTGAFEALTAEDIHAGTLDTGTLAASLAHVLRLVADDVSAGTVVADTLTAALMDAQVLTAGSADFDIETVTHLIGSVLQVTGLLESRLARIDNLYVTEANLANATLDRLTVLGTDGEYYDIAVGSDGLIQASVREVSAEEIAAGATEDGRGITQDAYDIDELAYHYISDPNTGLKTLFVEALSAGYITAQEAFVGSARIPELEATVIRAVNDRLLLYASEAVRVLIGNAEDYNSTFSFTSEGLRTRIGDSPWSTLVTADGYYIDLEGVPGHIGAFEQGAFKPKSIKMGDVTCMPTGRGGWAWRA